MVTKSIKIQTKKLTSCKNYKRHGKYISWYNNGYKYLECNYHSGIFDNMIVGRWRPKP